MRERCNMKWICGAMNVPFMDADRLFAGTSCSLLKTNASCIIKKNTGSRQISASGSSCDSSAVIEEDGPTLLEISLSHFSHSLHCMVHSIMDISDDIFVRFR